MTQLLKDFRSFLESRAFHGSKRDRHSPTLAKARSFESEPARFVSTWRSFMSCLRLPPAKFVLTFLQGHTREFRYARGEARSGGTDCCR